jgi:alcohol dehydrogenase (cytochrome c)
VPTSDVNIVALDIKNGNVVWDQAIGDRKDGFGLTGGPLVTRGKVMVGTIGRAAGGNVIVALDATTGKEAWRFHVIARPGEPGGNSWNGLPLDKRNGASVWIPGSYDAELNLAFFGPTRIRRWRSNPIPESSSGISNIRTTTSGISIGHSNGRSSSCRCSARTAPWW